MSDVNQDNLKSEVSAQMASPFGGSRKGAFISPFFPSIHTFQTYPTNLQ
jgi:hypothetical protein